MQVNENAGQVQQVKLIPDVADDAPSGKRAMPLPLDDGPGVPRSVATKKPEVAAEPKRKRFGAGF